MNKLFLILFILAYCLFLNAQEDEDFDNSPRHDSFYNGFNEGCIGRNIIQDIFWFDYDTSLSLSSISFGYMPDLNNGPSFFAKLDTGISGGFRKNGKKTVFLAWALGQKSCIVKTDFEKCSKAEKAYKLLSKTKLKINENFDNTSGMGTFHATSYHLIVNDSNNGVNVWSTSSDNSELEQNIEKATQLLKSCSSKALEELNSYSKTEKSK